MPEDRPDPRRLYDAVEAALATPRRTSSPADLDGLGNLCQIIQEHLQASDGMQGQSPVAARVGSQPAEIGS
jgi:predicted glycosyltransferase